MDNSLLAVRDINHKYIVVESIVGSDIVFLINGVFYNGSFQKIAQMNEFYRRSNVSVTKNGNFAFWISDSVNYDQYLV